MAFTLEQAERARRHRAARDAAGAVVVQKGDADDAIRAKDIFREWAPDDYTNKIGEVRLYNEYPYKVFQPHNSAQNPGWTPEAAPALWTPYHGTTVDTALPFRQPTGAHDIYKAGEMMIWTGGTVYRSKADTSFSPAAYPAAWEPADGGETTGGGDAGYPAWQPWDGNNAHLHQVGDRVTHLGRVWESTAGNNSWEPGVYGWKEV